MSDDLIDYQRILEAHDISDDWYYPPDFDYDAAERRFGDLAQEVQAVFGVSCRVESGSMIQDASFRGLIMLPPEYFNRPERTCDHVELRVSNWGSMATVGDDTALKPELLERVQALLQQFGYVYIPPGVLAAPYPKWPQTTWWIRYFDWI